MSRWLIAAALAVGTLVVSMHEPAQAGRNNVFCAAPGGAWCQISCSSDRGIACYASVSTGRCVKYCRYI